MSEDKNRNIWVEYMHRRRLFEENKSYKTARHLWLFGFENDIPIPDEAMKVFYNFLKAQDERDTIPDMKIIQELNKNKSKWEMWEFVNKFVEENQCSKTVAFQKWAELQSETSTEGIDYKRYEKQFERLEADIDKVLKKKIM